MSANEKKKKKNERKLSATYLVKQTNVTMKTSIQSLGFKSLN